MNIKYDYSDRVTIVTGTASGIGLATAKAFAESGASVVMADYNVDLLQQEADTLKDQGYSILVVKCYVSFYSDVKNLMKQTVDTFGKVDFAFNNVGVMAKVAFTADRVRLKSGSELFRLTLEVFGRVCMKK